MKKHIKTTISEYLNEDLNNTQIEFDDDYNFNLGDCDIYAISLHRLYGYPLYAIRGVYLEPEWGGERDWDYEYCHVMVKLPNGNFLDSSGEQTQEDMISRSLFTEDVKKVEIVEISEGDALNMFSCSDQEDDIKKVMSYIKKKYRE